MKIQISPAKPLDLPLVLTLLTALSLPTGGVEQHFGNFLVAHNGEHIVGCVGLEKYGKHALLRSLAVVSDWQGQGLGRQLTEQILAYAQANTVKEVVLLTTTAADFFARHFGFSLTQRSLFKEQLGNSSEWRLSDCASAACMVLHLP